ncbi:sigma-70 family RNA polymerase sigma factor [uncultured Sphingomonas sp.]|uniref:sigma-70 family RNA polymerase sigma factor n=1 Tax=uncultured Sphingomonas sp. TaxID=158754 RepID=UPI0035C9438A
MTNPAEARAQLTEALMLTGKQDRVAFRDVYRLTSAKLFGICLRICADRQAAEDVLHEVYLIVWRRAGAFEPGRASPITWLATIARNRAIDWRRANGRAWVAMDDVPEMVDASPLASDTIIADQTAHRLVDCLDELEERPRSAIRNAFFDGATYAELAVRQDVPLGTLKSWVRRGLMRLKECLDRGD